MGLVDAVKSIWTFFTPPDPPITDLFVDHAMAKKAEEHMKAMRRWMVRVSGTLLVLVLGLGAAFTPWGFVRAGDLQVKLSAEVEEAVKSIKIDLAKTQTDLMMLKSQSNRVELAVNEILRAQTAQNICRYVTRQKTEREAAERARAREDADHEQEKYKVLTGDFYPEARCGSGQ